MSKIVVLSTFYQGIPSANGICANNIVNALREMGNEVVVICYEGDRDNITINQDWIFTIPKPQIKENHNIFNKAVRIAKLAMGSNKSLLNYELTLSYLKMLNDINEKGRIDAIVAFYFPFESVEAMRLFCKNNMHVNSIVFELDSVGDGVSNTPLKGLVDHAYEKWLSHVYCEVTSIIIMKSHKEYWMARFGDYFDNKVIVSDIPVLLEKERLEMDDHEPIRLIYSGLIEKRYRSPTYLLQVLKELSRLFSITMSFYSKGDCEEEIQTASNDINEIHQYGYVEPDYLDKAILNSDYLISIGNSFSKSVPSKLITYISYGKPIIHFSSQNNDICNDYLNRYPLALVIDQSMPIGDSVDRIITFFDETKGKQVLWDDISNIFRENMPDYSARLIIDLIQ